MKKWFIAVISLLVLTACGKEELKDSNEVLEDETVGFEILGDTIQEASNVPEQEKNEILAAFDEYIAAFNEKDLERYKNIISKNAEGFKYEDDIIAITEVFQQYDVNREAEDVTIVNYKKGEAQVFSTLKTQTKELNTGAELAAVGRQVTVFVKEDQWKVSSIYYIGNE
ncbi:MAG: nuclear transport factor 2 family protein [Solibacillus sp.]